MKYSDFIREKNRQGKPLTGQSISSEIDNSHKKCLENRDKSEI
jgi:hypothetical protein